MIESIFFNPWVWIVGVILGLLLVFTIVSIVMHVLEWDSLSGWLVGWVFGGLLSLVVAWIYFVWLLPPYDAAYYQTYKITGEIESITRPLTDATGDTYESYTLRIVGVDDVIVISGDLRVRELTAGDDVTLACTKGFAYFTAPWWACNLMEDQDQTPTSRSRT